MAVDFSNERFGESVRERREHLGLSRADLAAKVRAAGLASFYPTTVTRIETGEQSVRLREALVIAELLGTDLYELISADDGLGGYLALQLEADSRAAIDAVYRASESVFNLTVAEDDGMRIAERMVLIAAQGFVSDHQSEDRAAEKALSDVAFGLQVLTTAVETQMGGTDDGSPSTS